MAITPDLSGPALDLAGPAAYSGPLEGFVMPGFDYRTLSAGDDVETPYGNGIVVPDGNGLYVVFSDGSGCSIHEATGLRGVVVHFLCEKDVQRCGACPACARNAPNINNLVDRFLAWPLPKDFGPDGGISFKNEPDARGYAPSWPVGTNLFTAEQARQMLEHILKA